MRRLDQEMVHQGLVQSRSQAERLIKLGRVKVGNFTVKKPGKFYEGGVIKIKDNEKYVARSGFKLASAAAKLQVSFVGKTILDVGSSTGGFTDYALQNGAVKSIAVDVGSNQLHPSLRIDTRIDLHEKTDIRNLSKEPLEDVDIVVIDVSFISLRDILPSVAKLVAKPDAIIMAMLKPQFEAGSKLKNKGVIKNDTIRRKILKDFEVWAKGYFIIVDKADSEVSGKKGNNERFYLLKKVK